jgi:phage FluMu gp28-like protein
MSVAEYSPDEFRQMRDSPSQFVSNLLEDDPWGYQQTALDFEADRQALACARQVGKSRMCSWRGIHKPVTSPGSTTLITAPTQRQSSELFNQVKAEMADSDIPIEGWNIERETRTTIEFTNGSRIICLPTGNDGKTIRGYTADLIIVDEAAFIDRSIFEDVLEPMLATTDGTMLLASTPFGTSGYFYDAFHREEWDTLQVPMEASPLIDEDYVKRQKETKTHITYRQEVLGEFVEAADAFLSRELIKSCTAAGEVQQQSQTTYLGVDLARHGEDATVFLSMDDEGNVFHTEHTHDKPLTDGIGRVKSLEEKHGYDEILIDETGLGAGVVDTLREDLRNIEGVTFTLDTKQSLYNSLKERMEAGELTLPENRQLRQQLADLQYELTSNGKTKIHHPDGGHDDFTDALALANWGRSQPTQQVVEPDVTDPII